MSLPAPVLMAMLRLWQLESPAALLFKGSAVPGRVMPGGRWRSGRPSGGEGDPRPRGATPSDLCFSDVRARSISAEPIDNSTFVSPSQELHPGAFREWSKSGSVGPLAFVEAPLCSRAGRMSGTRPRTLWGLRARSVTVSVWKSRSIAWPALQNARRNHVYEVSVRGTAMSWAAARACFCACYTPSN